MVPEQSGNFLGTMLGLRPGSLSLGVTHPLGYQAGLAQTGMVLTVGQKQSRVVADEPWVPCPPRAGAGALGDLAGGPGPRGQLLPLMSQGHE